MDILERTGTVTALDVKNTFQGIASEQNPAYSLQRDDPGVPFEDRYRPLCLYLPQLRENIQTSRTLYLDEV